MKPKARRPDQAAELDVDVVEDDVDDEDVEEEDEEEESEDEVEDEDEEDDELELSFFAAGLLELPLVLLEEERLSFR